SGIDLEFQALGIISISPAGLYLYVNVSLDAQITTVFHINASGTLLIDTTGPTNRFKLELDGSLDIASVLTISGHFGIDVGLGGPNTWRLDLNLSGSLGPI